MRRSLAEARRMGRVGLRRSGGVGEGVGVGVGGRRGVSTTRGGRLGALGVVAREVTCVMRASAFLEEIECEEEDDDSC